MKSFSTSSHVGETSDAHRPVFVIRNITGYSVVSLNTVKEEILQSRGVRG